MATELVQKIRAAIMPEDIKKKCLDLLKKCPKEMLTSLSKILENYLDKRNKELAVILKNDKALAAKIQRKLSEFENVERDSDAEDFLNSTKWE